MSTNLKDRKEEDAASSEYKLKRTQLAQKQYDEEPVSRTYNNFLHDKSNADAH